MSAPLLSIIILAAMFLIATLLPINMGALAFVGTFLLGAVFLGMETDDIIAAMACAARNAIDQQKMCGDIRGEPSRRVNTDKHILEDVVQPPAILQQLQLEIVVIVNFIVTEHMQIR